MPRLLQGAAFSDQYDLSRRAIANNAITIDDARLTDEKAMIGEADVTAQGVVKLSLGRKRHVLLKPV